MFVMSLLLNSQYLGSLFIFDYFQAFDKDPVTPKTIPLTPKVLSSSKGVENAKKRLRAFSIQKKTPITPIILPKTVGTGRK